MKQFCVMMIALSCFLPRLQAQDLGDRPASVKPSSDTIVYPLRSGLASNLSDLLMDLYPNSQIAAIRENNVLLIRVAADSRDELMSVLTQLDRPQRTIVVHAYLLRSHGSPLLTDETAGLSGPRDEVLERIAALQKRDQISIENRIEITTIENQEAMVQIGKQVPIATGTTITSSRGRTNSYKQVATGTIFSVEARTTQDDAIVMEINFEKSEIDYPVAGTDDAPMPPAEVLTLTHQTTVQFAAGEAVLAGTMVGRPADSSGHSYLVVTANLSDGSAKQRSAARITGGTMRTERPRSATTPGRTAGRLMAEQFEALARRVFDQADRDSNGFLTAEELDRRGVGARQAKSAGTKGISFDEYKKILASQRGVKLPAEDKVLPRTQQSEAKKPTLDPRYLAFAVKVLQKYDIDGDGRLNAKERGTMNNNSSAADADKDGFVSVEELAEWYKNK